jgi:hypothetical protein
MKWLLEVLSDATTSNDFSVFEMLMVVAAETHIYLLTHATATLVCVSTARVSFEQRNAGSVAARLRVSMLNVPASAPLVRGCGVNSNDQSSSYAGRQQGAE